jgi:TatD DNase family protein
MIYFDTHAHLDDEAFDADRDEVIARAERAGLAGVVCPGITAGSSEQAVRLAERYPSVYAAVGIQPNCCHEAAPGDWQRVEALAERPGVVALGETGLDRYWDFTPFEVQQDYFQRHLDLAAKLDLPVVVHCREAEADVLAMLREVSRSRGGAVRGVIHAFSGDLAMAEECLALGLFVSLAGPVTYRNKKFQGLREVSASVPSDRIVIETDSPYLVPHPLRGKQKRNEPALVALVAECLAELRGTTVEKIAAQTTDNARRLFRLG